MTFIGPLISRENDYNSHSFFFKDNIKHKNNPLINYLIDNGSNIMKDKIFLNFGYLNNKNITLFYYLDNDVEFDPLLIVNEYIPENLLLQHNSFKLQGINRKNIFIQKYNNDVIVNNEFKIVAKKIFKNGIIYFLERT